MSTTQLTDIVTELANEELCTGWDNGLEMALLDDDSMFDEGDE